MLCVGPFCRCVCLLVCFICVNVCLCVRDSVCMCVCVYFVCVCVLTRPGYREALLLLKVFKKSFSKLPLIFFLAPKSRKTSCFKLREMPK